MNKNNCITFKQIKPFVRYIHTLPISHNEYPYFTKAYDNRLFYVFKGSGRMFIKENTYNLVCGDLILWKSDIEYHMDTDDYMEFLAVNFDYTQTSVSKNYPIPPEKNKLFQKSDLLENIHFSDLEGLNDHIFLHNMFHFEELLLQMLREYDTKKIYYIERLNALFLSLLIDIVRQKSTTYRSKVNSADKVDQIISYIQLHYRESISNETIGKMFNYHPNYINRLMQNYTKKSLHQYLLAYRISKALDLLYTTNKSIYEISFEVGFDDPCHFSKVFKHKVGHSPSYYRKIQYGKE